MHLLRRTPHRRWLIGLALGLLVLTQSLGLVHRTQHGSAWLPAVQGIAVDAAGDSGDFGHSAGGTDCRLFDQLSHADLSAWPVLTGPCLAAGAEAPALAPAVALATRQWRAQARGPPRA